MNFIFILLLSISGSFGGIISDILYYLSFVIPTALAFAIKRRLGIEIKPPRVTISGENLGITLAVLSPSLSLIFLISYITSLILSPFGAGVSADVSGNIILVLLNNAVIIPFFEEMLFRYVPLSLLSEHSRRGAVLYSAAFFACVHCSIYQLPYAFVAGIIFAFLDIMAESITPSLLLHAVNNAISVLWLRYSGDALFSKVYILALVALSLISIPIIFAMRKKIKRSLLPIITEKKKVPFSLEAVAFFAATVLIAFINL